MNDTPDRAYLSRKEAAEYLTAKYFPISIGTLARYASQEIGPPPKTRPGGGQAIYRKQDLDEWASNFPDKQKSKPKRGKNGRANQGARV